MRGPGIMLSKMAAIFDSISPGGWPGEIEQGSELFKNAELDFVLCSAGSAEMAAISVDPAAQKI